MHPDTWPQDAEALQRNILWRLALRDPVAFARVQAALDDGGRLKIVLDKPDRVWRLRVRLVHRLDSGRANYWIWEQWEPWRPR
ncbi:hypothetical protein [Quisquiliibacterium transsilvanicum]|uniref:Uncharacterized protein n=1 Tax=Quisquiliibacterium transsilvanicum TaxID=1549638 RepID=A0A7W8M731_9BURK|nr:hypothetical protein [Quisquiliibacterium transsilvanicum]MBB5270313.1 hypothetical protein [Quisquiliibacterium transsilvanicum]